jgi:hypothetical protein
LSGKYLAGGPGTYTRIRGTGTEENPYVWAKQAATAQNNTQQSGGGQNISLTGTTWAWNFVENDLNTFTFTTSTNFSRLLPEWVGQGTYTVSGNKVTFTFKGQTKSFTGTISGNVLTIEGEGNFYKTATNNSGQSVGVVKSVNNAKELKEYLDSQPANSPDKPIKVAVKANDKMFREIAEVIKNAGKYVILDLSGSALTTIPEYAFSDKPTVTEEEYDGYMRVYPALVGITIPNSVTSIGKGAFFGCVSLEGIIIPNSVTSIRDDAFFWFISLTSITIPNSVKSIGDGAFWNCDKLTSVTFQGTTKLEGNYPFPGDLDRKYLAGGIGTYTTAKSQSIFTVWTKQR